jgi:WD40 repeat protein
VQPRERRLRVLGPATKDDVDDLDDGIAAEVELDEIPITLEQAARRGRYGGEGFGEGSGVLNATLRGFLDALETTRPAPEFGARPELLQCCDDGFDFTERQPVSPLDGPVEPHAAMISQERTSLDDILTATHASLDFFKQTDADGLVLELGIRHCRQSNSSNAHYVKSNDATIAAASASSRCTIGSRVGCWATYVTSARSRPLLTYQTIVVSTSVTTNSSGVRTPTRACLCSVGTLVGSISTDATDEPPRPAPESWLNVIHLQHPKLSAAAFSPNAALLATAGRDGLVRLWESATGTEIERLDVDQGGVLAVTFANDAQLITGGESGELVTWDLKTLAPLRRIKLPHPISGVLVHPEHGIYAGVSAWPHWTNLLLRIEETGSYSVLARRDRGAGLWSLAVSPNGRHLAAVCVDGHWDEFVGFWLLEIPSGRVLHERISGSGYYSGSVAFRDDEVLVVSPDPWIDDGSTIGAWGARMCFAESPSVGIRLWCDTPVAFHPDGRLLSLDYRGLLIGGDSGPDGYVPIGPQGGWANFIVTSALGHVAPTAGNDELVILFPGEMDSLAQSDWTEWE